MCLEISKVFKKPGMMVYAYDLNTWKQRQNCKFEASVGYILRLCLKLPRTKVVVQWQSPCLLFPRQPQHQRKKAAKK